MFSAITPQNVLLWLVLGAVLGFGWAFGNWLLGKITSK
jgi:hypothetical protein